MSRPIPISQIAAQLHRKNFPARADELIYPSAKMAPTPPATWTAKKQLALLYIASSIPFTKDCVAHMRALKLQFGQEELASLRSDALIYKGDIRDRRHKLTPTGKRLAAETAIIVARQLGLHHIRDSETGHDPRHPQFNKWCTCGFRTLSGVFTSRNRPSIDEQVAQHYADPEGWRKPKPPSPAMQAAFDRMDTMASGGNVVAFEHPDAIDIDDAINVYGDGLPDDTCDASPSGHHTFNCQTDAAVCIHCKRKT